MNNWVDHLSLLLLLPGVLMKWSFTVLSYIAIHSIYSVVLIFIVSLLSQAWLGHPCYDIIDNSTSFDEKIRRTVEV